MLANLQTCKSQYLKTEPVSCYTKCQKLGLSVNCDNLSTASSAAAAASKQQQQQHASSSSSSMQAAAAAACKQQQQQQAASSSSSGGGGGAGTEQSVRVLGTPAVLIVLQLNETRSAIIHRPHSECSLPALYQEALVKTRRPENGGNILENGLAAFKDCAGINAVPRCQRLGFCGTGSRC